MVLQTTHESSVENNVKCIATCHSSLWINSIKLYMKNIHSFTAVPMTCLCFIFNPNSNNNKGLIFISAMRFECNYKNGFPRRDDQCKRTTTIHFSLMNSKTSRKLIFYLKTFEPQLSLSRLSTVLTIANLKRHAACNRRRINKYGKRWHT